MQDKFRTLSVPAGLPNITGTIGADDRTVKGNYGCFYKATRDADTGSEHSEYGYRTWFDAEYGRKYWELTTYESNPTDIIYGNSRTVQPVASVVQYYICYA